MVTKAVNIEKRTALSIFCMIPMIQRCSFEYQQQVRGIDRPVMQIDKVWNARFKYQGFSQPDEQKRLSSWSISTFISRNYRAALSHGDKNGTASGMQNEFKLVEILGDM